MMIQLSFVLGSTYLSNFGVTLIWFLLSFMKISYHMVFFTDSYAEYGVRRKNKNTFLFNFLV